jgi:hypothetical protein
VFTRSERMEQKESQITFLKEHTTGWQYGYETALEMRGARVEICSTDKSSFILYTQLYYNCGKRIMIFNCGLIIISCSEHS